MPNPQQPELRRNGLGETTQDSQELRASVRDNPSVGGPTEPTPQSNQTEDAKRSGGSKSMTRDALES